MFLSHRALSRKGLLVGIAVFGTAETQAQPNQLGRWTPASCNTDHMRVHMALLPGDSTHHSKVISWHYGHTLPIGFWGWKERPSTAQKDCSVYPESVFTALPLGTGYPDLFCSGHSLLRDGDLLIAGGHQSANDIGLVQSIKFRRNMPTSGQWVQQGDMSQGRWYPTNTTLPDGKVLTFSGTRFWHMVSFGGTPSPLSPTSPAIDSITPLGINLQGLWLPTVGKPAGSTGWPEPREGHAAIWHPHPSVEQMLLFGGRRSGAITRLNDLRRLRLVDPTWKYQYEWFEVNNVTGTPPAARSHHSMIVLSDGRVVIYGGQDSVGVARSDVWVLRLNGPSWEWLPTVVVGLGPGARYGHAAVPDTVLQFGRNRMLVYGGVTTAGATTNDKVYALTLNATSDTATWVEQVVSGSKPEARYGHSIAVDNAQTWGGQPSKRYLLFGGRTATGLKNDVWEMMVRKSDGAVSWNLKSPANPPSPRARHAAIWDLTEDVPGHSDFDRMIVFGGEVAGGATSETWVLDNGCTQWQQLPSQPSVSLAGHTAIYHPLRIWALDPELYSENSGSWEDQQAPRKQRYYPFMFVLPSGNLFAAGSKDTTFLFRRVGSSPPIWERLPATGASHVFGGSAVSFRPGEIMKCGTEFDPASKITTKIRIEANDTSLLGWQMSDTMTADTLKRRIYHNLTLLPTGDVLVTGGLRGKIADAPESANPSVKQAQIWYPYLGTGGRGKWSGPLAADPARRGYHSTAMLLPDGRVLSAGGENTSTNSNWNKATMYCPPYLFDGSGNLAARPTIAGASDSITFGTRFTICTPQAATISSACLIGPGAVTHGFNQHQRYVPLPILDRCGQQLIVGAPGDSNNAPPGYYLLFILDGTQNGGVPAVARWVHVGGTPTLDECDTTAPGAVTDLLVSTGKTTATVSWTSPGDDGYCGTAQEFDLRYSSTPIDELNFYGAPRVPTPPVPVPGPPGTLHCVEVSGLAPCQWIYYAIKTRDDRNQWSAISNLGSGQTKCSGTTEVMCEFGGMFAQGGDGGGGWLPENSMFWEAPSSEEVDLYRLRRSPGLEHGAHQVRLLKAGGGRAEVDHVRLGVVDHAADHGAFPMVDRVAIGAIAPVLRVTDDTGADVTGRLDGSTVPGFVGSAGRSLRVVLAESGSSDLAMVIEAAGYRAGAPADSVGILVQKPDGGDWRTIARLYPRRLADDFSVDAQGSNVLRLLFLGEHEVRSVRRLSVVSRQDPSWLGLLGADHSRLGAVTGAVTSIGGGGTVLVPGDRLVLQFDPTSLSGGPVRDMFLYVRGSYTSNPGLSLARASEEVRQHEVRETFETALGSVRPSPSRGMIQVDYTLQARCDIRFDIYDIAGRCVRSMDLGERDEGQHRIVWDGRDDDGLSARPGVYLGRLIAGRWQGQRKLVIIAR